MKKFGLVGCGTIGTAIAKAIDRGKIQGKLIAIFDQNPRQAESLAKKLRSTPPILQLKQLAVQSDFIIEAASIKAVPEVARLALDYGKDLLVMSVGGILENLELLKKISQKNIHLYIPSGAIAGLDGIKAATIGRIDSLTLTTRKPPASFADSPYFRERKIDWKKIKTAKTLFEGEAATAVKLFPANINVAATLTLAALGKKKPLIKIIADPTIKRNIHEIKLSGEFGELYTRTENVPAKENPRTSQLAVFAAIATLQQITRNVHIGV